MAGRARHDLSFSRLLTGDMGQLIPCGLVEVLPGDTFRHNASVMTRLSPMAAPVYHSMNVRIHHFFVPHRLSWDEEGAGSSWEDFITGGPDGRDTSTVPILGTSGTPNDLFDYLGCPVENGIAVNSMPIRAYNMIYNEWYRDQDLVAAVDLTNNAVRNIAWEKDYFTSARPWPQKGEEVTLPLGIEAPIKGIGKHDGAFVHTNQQVTEPDGSVRTYGSASDFGEDGTPGGSNTWYAEEDPERPGIARVWADLTQATAASINTLRRASALQRFAEARARWGSRYAEYIRHEFGTSPLDSRLQRPEYLGGGSQRVSVSEILQTAPDDSGDPRFGVGDLYGHGVGMTRSNRYTAKFREHGYVMSLYSVRPKAMYSNGLERTWLRQDREDFYQRQLAHIGQQPVLSQEIWAEQANAGDVFGWQDRYMEYRETRSLATGEFRSLLDYWHLARQFTGEPALNQGFVEVNPDETKRIFNEQGQHSLWVFADHRLQAQRQVVRDATPRLL